MFHNDDNDHHDVHACGQEKNTTSFFLLPIIGPSELGDLEPEDFCNDIVGLLLGEKLDVLVGSDSRVCGTGGRLFIFQARK